MPRADNDLYPTPPIALEVLLTHETFEGSVFEPACGHGHLAKVFLRRNYNVHATDLIDYGFGIGGQDFLKYEGKMYDNIVTNPPYKKKLAQKFVIQAKKFARKKIAMFLRTNFLESQARYQMFQDKEFPLKAVYQFSERLSLYANDVRPDDMGTGTTAYAWYIFERGYIGEPIIKWIKPFTKVVQFEKHISKPKGAYSSTVMNGPLINKALNLPQDLVLLTCEKETGYKKR